MRESGQNAPGTEFDPDAPWNQVDETPEAFYVTLTLRVEAECEEDAEFYTRLGITAAEQTRSEIALYEIELIDEVDD